MLHSKIWKWSFVISLGGFLFGFDTAVISGCEKIIQDVWSLSDAMVGQMVAMALYGTVIGAIFGGMPAERWGRKTALIWIAAIYFISAVGSALAPEIYTLMIARFIGGLAVGASSVVAPMYITELSPKEHRGRLTALFQFNLVLGILMAYFSNWLIGVDGEHAWRWMLGVEGFPALLFLLLVFYVPESPRWLVIRRGDLSGAMATLAVTDPANAVQALDDIRESAGERSGSFRLRDFFSKKYRLPVLLAFLVAFFNQVSGINAVIYYAPRIFEDAGLASGAALLSTVGIGVINLVFTMAGLALIDRKGRRFLMLLGSAGYIVSLAGVAFVFSTAGAQHGLLIPFLLFVFIASHAIGQGAVIWVFISEIFPNRVRSWGNAWGCSIHWIFAAVIAGNFPHFAGQFGQSVIFGFFAVMMVCQLIFVLRLMPETKGVSLEEIERRMVVKN